MRNTDTGSAVVFRSEGFGDAPLVRVVGIHGEDPRNALPVGVGGGDSTAIAE